MLEPGDPRHGKASSYGYHACRCDLCREAARVHQARMRRDGLPPSAKVTTHATNLTVKWVKQNYPEVWGQFHADGVKRYGVGKSGRKPRAN